MANYESGWNVSTKVTFQQPVSVRLGWRGTPGVVGHSPDTHHQRVENERLSVVGSQIRNVHHPPAAVDRAHLFHVMTELGAIKNQ